ncbi:fumarate hydratase [Methanolobus sp. ZRKC5]|uniref:fumarate hydratase n=1 Tax=Methanolobus sp. ZRKC5 TaxID=3136295 RepID=UPI00313C8F14
MSNPIERDTVVSAIVDILREAETVLPQDVVDSLQKAASEETSPVAKEQLEAILKNIEIASTRGVPMCQDTGILIFFVELGRKALLDFSLEDAILEGAKKATESIPLRPNAVDPITRGNSGDNSGMGIPDIKYELVEGSSIKITVAPKGAGSENMSAIKMLNPTEKDRIRNFVLETVLNAGGKPCPPIIVGVGIGGSFDKSARLAKSALLEDVDNMNEEERSLLEDINSLGIGPMGLGGKTTALAVHMKKAHCHTASLPVAVNIQCWANRHASVTLGGDE